MSKDYQKINILNHLKSFLMTTLHINNGHDLFFAAMLLVVFVVVGLVLFKLVDASALMSWYF